MGQQTVHQALLELIEVYGLLGLGVPQGAKKALVLFLESLCPAHLGGSGLQERGLQAVPNRQVALVAPEVLFGFLEAVAGVSLAVPCH